MDRKYLLKESAIIFGLMYELPKTFKGTASWLGFLPVNDLTMFQVVLVLFLEFIISLS
jgi:hypothetical protein